MAKLEESPEYQIGLMVGHLAGLETITTICDQLGNIQSLASMKLVLAATRISTEAAKASVAQSLEQQVAAQEPKEVLH